MSSSHRYATRSSTKKRLAPETIAAPAPVKEAPSPSQKRLTSYGYKKRKPFTRVPLALLAKTGTIATQDLAEAAKAWFTRQPPYLQDSVTYLGVFKGDEKSNSEFLKELAANWNVSFGEKYAMECSGKNRCPTCSTQANSTCSNCQLKNPPLKMSLEQEAEKVYQMRRHELPLYQLNEGEQQQEQGHDETPQLLSLALKDSKARLTPCFTSAPSSPSYIVAFFKKEDHTPAQMVLMDKRNATVEWFNPSSESQMKGLQSQIHKAVRGNWSTLQSHPVSQPSDSHALWYLAMRLGFERQGGPQSFEKLSQAAESLSHSSAAMIFGEFFQEQ